MRRILKQANTAKSSGDRGYFVIQLFDVLAEPLFYEGNQLSVVKTDGDRVLAAHYPLCLLTLIICDNHILLRQQ